jgi:DNA-binding NarL/FixJ family response regulator
MSAVYEELVLIIGHAGADRLVAAYGGGIIRIPRAGQATVALVKLDAVIGPDLREQLVAHYGGEQLYIPRNAAVSLRERERRVVELAGQGLTSTQIASRMAYVVRPTYRWVARVLQRHRATQSDPCHD